MAEHRPFFAKSAILVLGLALLVFGQSMTGEFTNWDDGKLVLDNSRVTGPDIGGILVPRRGETYQPLRDLSHSLDYALAGDKPFLHHLHNTALHALASFLVIVIILQLTQKRELALFVGLAFLLHPQNVEAVAWISSRKYGLLAVFSLLAISASLRGWHGRAILAAALAFLASPIAMVLPILVPALHRLRGEPCHRRIELGYLALGLCIATFLLWMLTGGDDASPLTTDRAPQRYFVLIVGGLFEYLRTTVLPIGLSPHYQALWSNSGTTLRALAAVAILTPAAIFAIRQRKTAPLPLICLTWALLWWLPVSNIAPITTRLADRYWYLPSIGCFLAIGLFIQRFRLRKRIGTVILVLFAILAWRQSLIWQNSVTLWQAALAVESRDPVAHCNLGLARHRAGDVEGATADWQAGLALKPDDVALNNCLGYTLRQQGKPQQALPLLQRAVAGDPGNSRSQWNLGKTYLELGRHALAIQPLQAAAASEPDAQFDLATALVGAKRYQDALPVLKAVVAINPENGGLHFHLGNCLLALDDPASALPHLERGHALLPQNRAAKAALERAQTLLHNKIVTP